VPTGSYVYIDVDNDGDLDVITHPFQLTSVLWRNDTPKGPGLEVSLDDRKTHNRHGVGARVEIRAPDGRLQVREVKGSGGYESFDAPQAFFGLGDWPSVASIKVTWPDGTSSALDNLKVGPGRYTLTRQATN
jgi:ASPIC and UnbV